MIYRSFRCKMSIRWKETLRGLGETINLHFPSLAPFAKLHKRHALPLFLQGHNLAPKWLHFTRPDSPDRCNFCGNNKANAVHYILYCSHLTFVTLRHQLIRKCRAQLQQPLSPLRVPFLLRHHTSNYLRFLQSIEAAVNFRRPHQND